MNRNPTIALIIDPPLLLDALTVVLQQRFPAATLLGIASGADALRLITAPGQRIDFAVVNDVLPDIPGELLVKRLRWYMPHLRTVMVDSALARHRSVARAGGGAYLPTSDGAENRSVGSLANIIEALGRLWPDLTAAPWPVPGLPATPTAMSLATPAATPTAAGDPAADASGAAAPPAERHGMGRTPARDGVGGARGGIVPARAPFGPQRLTPRQMEVLGLLAQGWRNSTIAAHLHTSEKTVKAHVSAVFQVLDVSNRTQATLVAQRSGLVPG